MSNLAVWFIWSLIILVCCRIYAAIERRALRRDAERAPEPERVDDAPFCVPCRLDRIGRRAGYADGLDLHNFVREGWDYVDSRRVHFTHGELLCKTEVVKRPTARKE